MLTPNVARLPERERQVTASTGSRTYLDVKMRRRTRVV